MSIEKNIGSTAIAEGTTGSMDNFDLDALIADAESASVPTLNGKETEKIVDAETKKRDKKTSVDNTQRLLDWAQSLQANDPHIGDYSYQSILAAAVAESGIAAPDGTDKLFSDLKKASDALKKLAGIEPKNETLLSKMQQIEAVHSQILQKTKEVITDALETAQQKYKGEHRNLAIEYGELMDSPLVAGIEVPNTPEARETALKQEIKELLLRPSVEFSATEEEKIKKELNKKNRDGDKRELEERLRLIPLALETNRLVIEEVIGGKQSENDLRTAFTEMKTFLQAYRKHDSSFQLDKLKSDVAGVTTPLAKKILGTFEVFAVKLPTSGDYLAPTEQLTAGTIVDDTPDQSVILA